MSLERIVKGLRLALLCSGILAIWTAPLLAQKDRPAPARRDRDGLNAPELRVAQQAAQPKVDPELERLLRSWATTTEKIQKLQGRHYRFEYDKVFEVEKRAEGMFYYEAPSKGRIDIEGRVIEKGDVSTQIGKKSGQPYKLESASPEKWISNGNEIQKIDDKEKSVDIVTIPKELQGPNIMDGPLPFLFGMPPEKAKQRYRMKIIKKSGNIVMLEVEPLLRHDAENWRRAWLQLDIQEFLPAAVKLEDPSGNKETVYVFRDMEKNKRQSLFKVLVGENIFAPKLRGYTKHMIRQENIAGPPQEQGAGFKPGTVPDVTRMHARDAEAKLKQAGYRVSYEAGKTANNNDFAYRVYDQQPKPGTPLEKDKSVRITYYEHDDVRKAAKPPGDE